MIENNTLSAYVLRVIYLHVKMVLEIKNNILFFILYTFDSCERYFIKPCGYAVSRFSTKLFYRYPEINLITDWDLVGGGGGN